MACPASNIKLSKFNSFLFIPFCFVIGASCQTLVTYSSKSSEELLCPITDHTIAATWRDETTGNNLANYVRGGQPDIEIVDPGSKHNNYMYYVSSTSFSIFIQPVQAEDGGDYICSIVGGGGFRNEYTVVVEVIPGTFSLNCFVPPDVTCPEQGVNPPSDLICVCAANGVRPDTLYLDIPDAYNVQQNESIENGELYDLRLKATVPVTESTSEVTCSVIGYNTTEPIPSELITKTFVLSPPTCSLDISFDQECKVATLTCSCTASPTDGESPSDKGMVYSYFNGTGHMIESETTTTVETNDVAAGAVNTYSCRGCNGIYYGDTSYVTQSSDCTLGTTALPTAATVTTASPSTNERTRTKATIVTTEQKPITDPQSLVSTTTKEQPSTTDNMSIECNYTGRIAACIVEATIILVLIIVIIYLIARDRLGPGKKTEPRSTNQIEEIKGAENRAYMDLQELEVNKNKKNKNLEVPETNVKLVSNLPGKGMLRYHKALVMRAEGNLEAVVRTLSGDSTLRMNELQSSEVQHIFKLPGDNSIMKLFGWCDTVPNYLICENLSGGTLSDHLTEEFSSQKVHQYGNTKRKRFQVAEKGNAEHLPKYALQVARGLKFLTKHRFVSPGLRSKKVLLDAAGRCKLYDFVSMENAKEWTKLFWNGNVPFQWMPPEFLFLETISPAGDVWSFGVLLWEIFSYGSEPYKGQTRADVEKSLRAKRQLLLPDNCPGAIWQVMITCWEPAVEERLKIDDVTYKLAAMCQEDKEYQEIG
ncbi:uncharacterized protein [Apostichopus japonicus]|uniref:uncharacterized protein isoform X2 n=1 Tax=Stichopus japonicus TaxID=307972 RepID=UPI003AB43137